MTKDGAHMQWHARKADEQTGLKNAGGFSRCMVFSLMGIFLWCSACSPKAELKAKAEKVVNVKVQPAATASLRPSLEAVGNLLPAEEVTISSEVDGNLLSVQVEEGQLIAKGDVIALVKDTDYRLSLQQALTNLKQIEATLANTRLEYERKATLAKEELVSKQMMDEIRMRLAVAGQQKDSAQATLSLVQERLDKCRIRAPLAGRVKQKVLSAGDFVRASMPVAVIIQDDPLKLSFSIPEKDMALLKPGQDVVFSVDALPGKSFAGALNTVYPQVDERTRTLQAEALIPNAHKLLKAGLFARVKVYTSQAHAGLVIPLNAVLYDDNRTKVFVLSGDHAEERFIQLGAQYGERVEVLSGLKPGESIIVAGQNNLSSGSKIKVVS